MAHHFKRKPMDRALARHWSNGVEQLLEVMTTPQPQPGKVRTLADMTEEEISEIEAHLGAKVKRPR